jgi:hypothetical protein
MVVHYTFSCSLRNYWNVARGDLCRPSNSRRSFHPLAFKYITLSVPFDSSAGSTDQTFGTWKEKQSPHVKRDKRPMH